jgi:hypothetical protein
VRTPSRNHEIEGETTMAKFTGRRSVLAIAGGAILLSATVAVAPSQAAADTSTKSLSVSDKSDRSKPHSLGNQTIAGTKWIFLQNDTNVSKVLFFIDQPDLATITHTEEAKPFDLQGTKSDGSAQGLDTKTLKEGKHSVAAVVLSKNHKIDVLNATFTVQNVKPATPPKKSTTTPPAPKKPVTKAPAAKEPAKKAPPAKPAPKPAPKPAAPPAKSGLGDKPATPPAKSGLGDAPAKQGLGSAPNSGEIAGDVAADAINQLGEALRK